MPLGQRLGIECDIRFFINDYKARFNDYHMCVGCGRCTSRCPEYISVTATVEKMATAVAEIEVKGDNHE